jgi:hypothetical protein
MKLRLLLLAAVVASLFIAGPIAEGTAGPGYPSVLTIKASNPTFHGRIHLRRAGHHPRLARPCRKQRQVALFWRHNGKIQRIGVTRTNRLGRWTIRKDSHNGRYFAQAKRRVLPKRGNKVCERAVSPRIVIH